MTATFSRGLATLRVPATLHAACRRKAAEGLAEAVGAGAAGGPGRATILLEGGKAAMRDSTDHEELFRQESYFHYLFGVAEDGFYGAVDVPSGQATLFIPRLPAEYAVWMGKVPSPEDVKAKYGVDSVHYIANMPQVLAGSKLYLLAGTNTDSGATSAPAAFDGIAGFEVDAERLHPVLTACRVFKTPEELEVMRYASRVSSAAHVATMRATRPGMMEYQLESTFLHHCYFHGGCRLASYTSICASGAHGAVLHYGHHGAPNDGPVEDGHMVLCDMGAEYAGYAADITCSYPANGRFTPTQAAVYNAVLDAHQSVLRAMRPGVRWPEMHRLAERTILRHLVDAGFLVGDVEELMAAEVGALFMPHGLGHLLGIDTHDVGGYGPGLPERPAGPGINRLRTARTLEAGMVMTVEPGCYFNAFLLEPALAAPATARFFVADKVRACLDFGGVRIEDNVIITADGSESMTDVPRTVAEIEAVMAGGAWPPEGSA